MAHPVHTRLAQGDGDPQERPVVSGREPPRSAGDLHGPLEDPPRPRPNPPPGPPPGTPRPAPPSARQDRSFAGLPYPLLVVLRIRKDRLGLPWSAQPRTVKEPPDRDVEAPRVQLVISPQRRP